MSNLQSADISRPKSSQDTFLSNPEIVNFLKNLVREQKLFQSKKRDVFNFNNYMDVSKQEYRQMQSHKRDTLNFNFLIDKTYQENQLMQQKKRDGSYFSPFENNSEVNFSQTCEQKNLFRMTAQKKLYRPDVNVTCDAKNLKHKMSPSQTQSEIQQHQHKSKDNHFLKQEKSNKNILYNYLKKHDRDRLKHQKQNMLNFVKPDNKKTRYLFQNSFQINQLQKHNDHLHTSQNSLYDLKNSVKDGVSSKYSKSYMDQSFTG